VELRRLRQRVELPRMEPARDDVVARAFGRRPYQHRRLDLEESLIGEILTHAPRHLVTEDEARLERLAPQVEIAIAEAKVLGGGRGLIQRKRRRLARVQDRERIRLELDPAGRKIFVL